MTIPDIGHCAGSGAEPAIGSVRQARAGLATGVCPACLGRFELAPRGVLGQHDAAELEQREARAAAHSDPEAVRPFSG